MGGGWVGGPSNFSVNQSQNLWNLEFNNLDLDSGLDNIMFSWTPCIKHRLSAIKQREMKNSDSVRWYDSVAAAAALLPCHNQGVENSWSSC